MPLSSSDSLGLGRARAALFISLSPGIYMGKKRVYIYDAAILQYNGQSGHAITTLRAPSGRRLAVRSRCRTEEREQRQTCAARAGQAAAQHMAALAWAWRWWRSGRQGGLSGALAAAQRRSHRRQGDRSLVMPTAGFSAGQESKLQQTSLAFASQVWWVSVAIHWGFRLR